MIEQRHKSFIEIMYEAATEHKYKRIKEASDKGEEVYFLTDYETGCPYEVSKEHYDSFHKMVNECKPKFNDQVGYIMFYGTGGNSD